MFRALVLSVAVFLMGTGVAPAEEGAKKHGQYKPMFERMDKDGDGFVASEEAFSSGGEHFDKIDGDKDGTLTKEEIDAYLKQKEEAWAEKQKERQAKSEEKHKTRLEEMLKQFATLDVDGDGKISRDQYASESRERLKKMDKDGDGKATRDEMKAFHAEHHPKMRGRGAEMKMDEKTDEESSHDSGEDEKE